MSKVAVIGAGSWGTSLALLLAGKGEQVFLWGHNTAHIENLETDRENRVFLPGYTLPPQLNLTSDLQLAVQGAQCVVMVVPSHAYRDVFSRLYTYLEGDTLVASAVKGIEIGTRMTMTQVMADLCTEDKKLQLGVLSGPSFAKEVADRQPTAVTASFPDIEAAKALQHLFATDYFRVYSATDVIGLEVSGAMKNVIAIAAGICDGLGFGLNSRAALITRGLAEMSRLGVALGAEPLTFAGLGGLGDLVLTCTGNLSRNRSVGLRLGEGEKLPDILAKMTMVAEGVKTTKSCFNLSEQLKVEMPILEQVYKVLYLDKDCRQAVHDLFQRDLKQE